MKQLFLIAAICLSVSFVNAQKIKSTDVPSVVTSLFVSLYPNIKNAKWEKEEANYEAVFDLNKKRSTVTFDAKGNLMETETEMEVSALPIGCSDYSTKNCSEYKIKGVAKITDSRGVVTYEAELKKGMMGDEMDLFFDSKGNFIKKVVEESKPEEEDDEKKK